jgi:hypothetical protein
MKVCAKEGSHGEIAPNRYVIVALSRKHIRSPPNRWDEISTPNHLRQPPPLGTKKRFPSS